MPNISNWAAAAFWSCILVACILALVYIILKPLPSMADRAKFFDEQVQGIVAEADVANRQAADRCQQRLHDVFLEYRKGIKPFSDDLTSWGTRLGVIRRMPSDWWYKETDVKQFVTEKFQKHLFSEASLQRAIDGALGIFREDIDANANRLLTNVQAAVSKSDLPAVRHLDRSDFSSDVAATLQEYSASAATGSVTNFILTELASGVGGAAAGQIVTAIGARVATMAATTSAGAGGATAGGAAAGGGGGSVGGPVGAVVGFGVGLAVGVVIDMWMSSRFEVELSKQLNGMIDRLESSVIDGGQGQKGVRISLAESCDALRDAYRQSLYNRIVAESMP